MSNTSQNNEIENIDKGMSLLQDRLEIKEKSLNQFKNGLRRIRRSRLKQVQKTNLFKTKKMQDVLRDIFENKIKYIKRNSDLLNNALVNVQKKGIIWKRIKENSKNAKSFTKWI